MEEITRPCCGRGYHVYIAMEEITRPCCGRGCHVYTAMEESSLWKSTLGELAGLCWIDRLLTLRDPHMVAGEGDGIIGQVPKTVSKLWSFSRLQIS